MLLVLLDAIPEPETENQNQNHEPKRCLVYEGESLRAEVFFENGFFTVTVHDYLLNEIRHIREGRWVEKLPKTKFTHKLVKKMTQDESKSNE